MKAAEDLEVIRRFILLEVYVVLLEVATQSLVTRRFRLCRQVLSLL